jgi:hypothetical protein
MCPLILNEEETQPPAPTERFDPHWVDEVATRCRLAQNCLSAVQSAAPPDWHALTVLINNDVPKILDKVTQLLQGARD